MECYVVVGVKGRGAALGRERGVTEDGWTEEKIDEEEEEEAGRKARGGMGIKLKSVLSQASQIAPTPTPHPPAPAGSQIG